MDLWHLETCAQKKKICNSLMTRRHSFLPKWVHSAQLPSLKISRRLCHWASIVALGVTALCPTTGMVDSVLWYWPLHTTGGSVNLMLIRWTVMILYNYSSAILVGPGFFPSGAETPTGDQVCNLGM